MKNQSWILFITFVLSLSAAAKTKVAAVFADNDLCKTKMCLHGSFKKGTPVVLISKETDKTCTAKVGVSFKAAYEPGAFEASELNNIRKCKLNPKQVFLAVFEKPKLKYKIFPVEELEAEALKAADEAVKKSHAFSRAWKREIFHKDGDADKVTYTVADYRQMEMIGFRSRLPKKEEILLMKNKFIDGSNDGIYFAFYKKEWSAVSSSFTVGRPFVFSLNGRYFVSTTVSCQLNCGYQDLEIYEFNSRVFKLIYNNADFST